MLLRDLLHQSLPSPVEADEIQAPERPRPVGFAVSPHSAVQEAPNVSGQAPKRSLFSGLRETFATLIPTGGAGRQASSHLPIPEPGVPLAVYVASLSLNLLALGLPLVMMQVYDRVLPNRSYETLSMMIIGLSIVLALDLALKTARAHMTGWLAATFNFTATVAAMERLMRAPYRTTEEDTPTIHMARLAALSGMADFYGGMSRMMVIDLPFVSIFLAMLFFVGGSMALIPLALFAVFALLARRRNRELRRILEERAHQDERKFDFVNEAISGIQTVKTFAMEPQMMRRFERLQQAVAVTTKRSIMIGGEAQAVSVLYGNISQIVIVAFGAIQVVDQNLSMGGLACCTLLSGQVLQPLLRGIAIWSEIEGLAVKRKQVDHLFSLPEPLTEADEVKSSTTEGHVELKGIALAAAGGVRGKAFALDHLDIPAGTILGIRGDGTSRASSLMRVIMGDLPPATGSVRVDGVELYGEEGRNLRRSMAYVGAQSMMFRASIIDNIAMFARGKDRETALEAARLVGLEDEIHLLPDGYDAKLADGIAVNFPASFLQRIAIARALARNPRVLVFDEVNAMLDMPGDKALMRALDALRGRLTVILVSQRPSFLACADHVLEFDAEKGLVAQAATPVQAQALQEAK